MTPANVVIVSCASVMTLWMRKLASAGADYGELAIAMPISLYCVVAVWCGALVCDDSHPLSDSFFDMLQWRVSRVVKCWRVLCVFVVKCWLLLCAFVSSLWSWICGLVSSLRTPGVASDVEQGAQS